MTSTGSLIVIDGNHGEGGSALVRIALVLSALTQQPVRIENVRGGTNYPGLDIEDVCLLSALATSTGAETTGAEIGSKTVSFLPTKKCSALKGRLDIDSSSDRVRVPNANIVLNSLLPALARAGAYSQVELRGETYGTHSLGFDYMANVTFSALRRFGLHAFPELIQAGFGREGGGEVHLEVEPSALRSIDWADRGEKLTTRAVIAISELPMTIAHRGLAHLTNLGVHSKIPVETEIIAVDSRKPGLSVTVWTEFERGFGGATALGAKGIRAEAVVQTAFEEMREWIESGRSADPFLADQILPTAILAEGESIFTVSRLTKRFLTLVWVIKQFLPIHVTVKGQEGEPGEVRVRR